MDLGEEGFEFFIAFFFGLGLSLLVGLEKEGEFFGDIGEEAGGIAFEVSSEAASFEGAEDVESLFGAGDADITEAPFFFDIGFFALSVKGQEAVFHTDEENDGVFEAFGPVEGDQGDVIFFGFAIIVFVAGVEGDAFEVVIEGRLIDAAFVLFDGVDQGGKVVDTGFGFVGIFVFAVEVLEEAEFLEKFEGECGEFGALCAEAEVLEEAE